MNDSAPLRDTFGPRSPAAKAALEQSAAAARRAGFATFRHVKATASTNEDLAAEARQGSFTSAVLVADHQSAGRGRRSRRWIDGGGGNAAEASLLVSFRLAARAADAHDRVAAVAASALCAAAEAVAKAGAEVHSKWPNDLMLRWPGGSGKLAGLLAEMVAPRAATAAVIVGVGVNIADAPAGVGAASLACAGAATTRDSVLASLLTALPGYLADPRTARRHLLAASCTVGRIVRVERVDGTSVVGRAERIDSAGRLHVRASGAVYVFDAGDVFHLREASSATR